MSFKPYVKGKQAVLLPSKVPSWYCMMKQKFGGMTNSHLKDICKDSEYEAALMSNKLIFALVYPSCRQGYYPCQNITMADWVNTQFLEIYAIPVKSWLRKEDGGYKPIEIPSHSVINFLCHGRSAEGFMKLLVDCESKAFEEWLKSDRKQSPQEYIEANRSKVLASSLIQIEFLLAPAGKSKASSQPSWFLKWSLIEPQNQDEKDLLAIAQEIGSDPEADPMLINDVFVHGIVQQMELSASGQLPAAKNPLAVVCGQSDKNRLPAAV